MTEGGIAVGLNHAIRQRRRAGSQCRPKVIPLWVGEGCGRHVAPATERVVSPDQNVSTASAPNVKLFEVPFVNAGGF
jgi:hypothetical protein